MISVSLFLFIALLGLASWLAFAHVVDRRQALQQSEIVARGESCRGRVLAVQRPFLFESTTRLYFEFAPPGAERPVQCCHTERRSAQRTATSLPSAGTFVTVRYLPERPEAAVIGKLVADMN